MNANPNEGARATTEGNRSKASKDSPPTCETGLDHVTTEEHIDDAQHQSDRLECLKIVMQMPGTVKRFLETRQPGLGDLTGQELLEQQPADLLRRLRELGHG